MEVPEPTPERPIRWFDGEGEIEMPRASRQPGDPPVDVEVRGYMVAALIYEGPWPD